MSYGDPASVDTEGSPPPSSRIPDNQCPWPFRDAFCETQMDDQSIVERDWALQFAHYKAIGKSEVEAYDAATHCLFDCFLSMTTTITKEHS